MDDRVGTKPGVGHGLLVVNKVKKIIIKKLIKIKINKSINKQSKK